MWKRIEDSNYEVSIDGMVRNINSKIIIKGGVCSSGYKIVSLYIGGKKVPKMVHRLVALTFIDNPENKPQVNHIDKNKLNNNIDNLEWVTPKENMKHHYDNGGVKRNNQTYKDKFGKEHNRSVKLVCNGVIYYGYSEASRITGVKLSTIHYCVKNNKPFNGLLFELYEDLNNI